MVQRPRQKQTQKNARSVETSFGLKANTSGFEEIDDDELFFGCIEQVACYAAMSELYDTWFSKRGSYGAKGVKLAWCVICALGTNYITDYANKFNSTMIVSSLLLTVTLPAFLDGSGLGSQGIITNVSEAQSRITSLDGYAGSDISMVQWYFFWMGMSSSLFLITVVFGAYAIFAMVHSYADMDFFINLIGAHRSLEVVTFVPFFGGLVTLVLGIASGASIQADREWIATGVHATVFFMLALYIIYQYMRTRIHRSGYSERIEVFKTAFLDDDNNVREEFVTGAFLRKKRYYEITGTFCWGTQRY